MLYDDWLYGHNSLPLTDGDDNNVKYGQTHVYNVKGFDGEFWARDYKGKVVNVVSIEADTVEHRWVPGYWVPSNHLTLIRGEDVKISTEVVSFIEEFFGIKIQSKK